MLGSWVAAWAGLVCAAPPASEGDPDPGPPVSAPAPAPPVRHQGGFRFSSNGQIVAAGDLRGHPARNADIVARGSRWDELTAVELHLLRDDDWQNGAHTRVVTTVAIRHPIFHYDGDFAATIALRNLYVEGEDLGLKGLSFWAGSRMYRGDGIYVFDWWPLDNLNTIGGGAGYRSLGGSFAAVHAGVNQPNNPFFRQTSARPAALGQPGAVEVAILNRQKLITSYKLGHVFDVGRAGGVRLLGYGETHHLRAGVRELDAELGEVVPGEHGFVAGGELSLFTGQRDTHVNLWVRHAWNLAAYGELASPSKLALDGTTKGARELILALDGNYEVAFFGLMLGAYFRRYRDASPDIDANDLNEGVVLLRPLFWFGDLAGVALEASYQAQQRGGIAGLGVDESGPVFASMWRAGVMPFLAFGGRGSFARPHIRGFYMASVRDRGARSLYARDDELGAHRLGHLLGVGAEWSF